MVEVIQVQSEVLVNVGPQKQLVVQLPLRLSVCGLDSCSMCANEIHIQSIHQIL